jgi:PTS system galactitol-specific IIA component
VVCEALVVFPDRQQAETNEQVIGLLCGRLVEQGYIDPAYAQKVLDREHTFPTGLPTIPFATAIPHADADHVHATGIAIAILKYPVPFRSMEAPETSLGVWVVWLLAVKDAGKQVAMLQWVITTLQDRSLMEKLVMAADASKVMALLKPVIAASAKSL